MTHMFVLVMETLLFGEISDTREPVKSVYGPSRSSSWQEVLFCQRSKEKELF